MQNQKNKSTCVGSALTKLSMVQIPFFDDHNVDLSIRGVECG
jgi:hypothetical protein